MEIIEDKLRELESIPYLGRYPKDFSEFWLESLRTDHRVTARLELERISYPIAKVEVFSATVLAGDEVELKGYYLRPALTANNTDGLGKREKIELSLDERVQSQLLPGIVRFHGYSGNRGQISELLLWALQGYAILALDVRGQSGETPDHRVYPSGSFSGWMTLGLESPRRHYFRQVYLDAVRAVAALANQSEVDERRIGCIGKSQGGGLAVAAAALTNTLGKEVGLRSQVKAVSAAIPFLCDFRRGYQLQSDGPLDELVWYFKLHDPEHRGEKEIFKTLDYFDTVHFAPWLGEEVSSLVSMGLKDTVCPPITIYALYRAIHGKKQLLAYPEYGHESPDEFVDRQIEFLAGVLGV
ncbi:acetyl esterase (deacetylase) [Desulfitobacterium dichloroeliminans LMG P-21439]|uniref:Acetyl esterase (Deacetylase) n=1 Tax=Desulfitobacterium dichloroeliminans (strain LMG P-21439 / DCA1) TaxID=871963 RepID=L0F4F7_DESDL|nr:acetylxylan esterase [Desulfitobacterium dichloroeliminans]AGA67828.1 acetyl esterase (deacetylase) [Desulfitobacterium dichloroeliminans LMG P-21439]